MRYPIVIHKDTDSDYGVTIPDLPGCFSAGVTLDDALVNAREAIECHLEGLLSAGEALPQPGSIDDHRQAPEYAEGTWALVDIDLSRLDSKVRRINISMPERVLAVIDEEARRSGETRSGFLAKAAFEYIDRHRRVS
jgi:predicted RNase H-like HicB family nuclease